MKKIAVLVIAAVLGMGMAWAQTFKVEANGKTITEDETIEVKGVPVDHEIKQYFVMTNLTEEAMKVRLDFTIDDMPEGAELAICGFGGCRVGNFLEDELAAGAVAGSEKDPLDLAYTVNEAYSEYTTAVRVINQTQADTLRFFVHFVPQHATFDMMAGRVQISEGSTLEVTGGTKTITQYFEMKNLTDSAMNVWIGFSNENMPEGTELTICGFGGCRVGNFADGTIEANGTGGSDTDPLDIAYTTNAAFDDYTTTVTVKDETSGYILTFKLHFAPQDLASETFAKAAIAAYPNPAAGQVRFRLDNVKGGSSVVLRDLTGKTVRKMTVNGSEEITMSLAGISSGLYFYSVEENGSSLAVGKLMVR